MAVAEWVAVESICSLRYSYLSPLVTITQSDSSTDFSKRMTPRITESMFVAICTRHASKRENFNRHLRFDSWIVRFSWGKDLFGGFFIKRKYVLFRAIYLFEVCNPWKQIGRKSEVDSVKLIFYLIESTNRNQKASYTIPSKRRNLKFCEVFSRFVLRMQKIFLSKTLDDKR